MDDNASTSQPQAERRHVIIRTAIISCIGCTVLGAVFLTGGHTLRQMSIFMFGWAIGCAVFLIRTVIGDRIDRHRHSGEK